MSSQDSGVGEESVVGGVTVDTDDLFEEATDLLSAVAALSDHFKDLRIFYSTSRDRRNAERYSEAEACHT